LRRLTTLQKLIIYAISKLLTKVLDHDDGEAAASMNVKRGAIIEEYGAANEALYVEQAPA